MRVQMNDCAKSGSVDAEAGDMDYELSLMSLLLMKEVKK